MTHTLTYIEETRKHHDKLEKVARRGVRKGIKSAIDAGLYITYAKNGKIIREYPDGHLEITGEIEGLPMNVSEDARFTLS